MTIARGSDDYAVGLEDSTIGYCHAESLDSYLTKYLVVGGAGEVVVYSHSTSYCSKTFGEDCSRLEN